MYSNVFKMYLNTCILTVLYLNVFEKKSKYIQIQIQRKHVFVSCICLFQIHNQIHVFTQYIYLSPHPCAREAHELSPSTPSMRGGEADEHCKIQFKYFFNTHRIHALNTRSWRCSSDSHSDTLNTQIRVEYASQVRVKYASNTRHKYASNTRRIRVAFTWAWAWGWA